MGKLSRVCDESIKFRMMINEVNISDADKSRFKHKFCSDLMLQDYRNFDIFIKLFEKQKNVKDKLIEKHKLKLKELDKEKSYLKTIENLLQDWILNEDEIRPWSNLLKQIEELHLLGADEIVKAYCSGTILDKDLMKAVECNISYELAKTGISKSKVLSSFFGSMYEADIEKYSDLVKRFEELTKRELRAKLSANIPNAFSINDKSAELNILQKAIKSGGRMMSIRKLFDNIPDLMRQMCPCMLMSPMSVAQYIDPQYPKFDLVIFDEASQMPTCEAVGAIARGKNVVVVGDPKQMPPTSFFNGNKIDEENYEKEDLESVLDDCLALMMPEKRLLWHYRSRDESLIAFSNSRFYDNKLYTFPSPKDLVSEVKWIPVDGYYDRGGTRQNKAEAEMIVGEIIRRLSDEQLRKNSIGVVTFSSTQQTLIDDLLAAEFARNPDLELFNKEAYESILIKNLENVQGDERDVILLSIGYGPDREGKDSMNFGPLNNAGGWRRLNVAITRSRKEMLVYSTVRPEDINLTRTRYEGVAALKGFLEFAAKGKNSLVARYDQIKPSAYRVEDNIADTITKLGYQVRKQIGCSEFKIDIGVIDPLEPSRYLLGILCDGKNYKSANTTRDRNILQPEILRNLGWRIHRVWTIDWMMKKNEVLEQIKNAIKSAEDEFQSCRNSMENTSSLLENWIPEKGVTAIVMDTSEKQKLVGFVDNQDLPDQIGLADHVGVIKEKYVVTNTGLVGNIDNFYDAAKKEQVISIMTEIVEAEGPISRKLLGKRIINAYGIARTGNKVDAYVEECIRKAKLKSTKTEGIKFYWAKNQDVNNYRIYRISNNQDERRSMDDICAQELANVAVGVLERKPNLNLDELPKEMARELGFGRVTDAILMEAGRGIKFAEKSMKI